MSNFSKFLLQAGFAIVIINLAGLWFVSIVQQRQVASLTQQVTTSPEHSKTVATSDVVGLQQQQKALDKRVTDIETTLEELPSASTLPDTSPSRSISSTPVTRESIVFIGTGSSRQTTWTNLSSTEISIDTAQYPGLKEVRFEASLSIWGGNASARLVNKSTGGVFYPSTVSHNASTAQWVSSPTFTLPAGRFTYVVQVLSSSGEQVNLEGARLRMIVQE